EHDVQNVFDSYFTSDCCFRVALRFAQGAVSATIGRCRNRAARQPIARPNDTGRKDRTNRSGYFLAEGALTVVISLLGKRPAAPGGQSSSGTSLAVDASMFKVSNGFLAGTLIVCGGLAALYAVFWLEVEMCAFASALRLCWLDRTRRVVQPTREH